MERKLLEEIVEDVSDLRKKLPSSLVNKINYINLVKTYSIVIEGKQNYVNLKSYLSRTGYSDFQNKEENENFTLVFQNNGFNQISNILSIDPDGNLGNKRNTNHSINDENYNKEIEDLNKINNNNKLIINQQNNIIEKLKITAKDKTEQINNIKKQLEIEQKEIIQKSINYYEENLQFKNQQIKSMEEAFKNLEKTNRELHNEKIQLENSIGKIKQMYIHKEEIEKQYYHRQIFSDKLRSIMLKEEKLTLMLCILGVDQQVIEQNLADYIMNY